MLGIVYVGSLLGTQALQKINGHSYDGSELVPATGARKADCRYYARYLSDHILIILHNWLRNGNQLGKKRSEEFYTRAMHDYIRNHYNKDISLSALAALLNMHANHLGMLISQSSGHSFRQHLNDYRIQRAQIILRSTSSSITEVAYMCGFQDSNYFSTAFKKHSGQSPRSYRKT